jgi:hypothetical protein
MPQRGDRVERRGTCIMPPVQAHSPSPAVPQKAASPGASP